MSFNFLQPPDFEVRASQFVDEVNKLNGNYPFSIFAINQTRHLIENVENMKSDTLSRLEEREKDEPAYAQRHDIIADFLLSKFTNMGEAADIESATQNKVRVTLNGSSLINASEYEKALKIITDRSKMYGGVICEPTETEKHALIIMRNKNKRERKDVFIQDIYYTF